MLNCEVMFMAKYSIRDLEKLSGIKAHTLRIWEKRYNLVEPKRTNTNIRYYDDGDLKKILNIALLNHNGIKISKIAQFDNAEICNRINDLSQNSNDAASMIDNMVISMVELDEKKFEKTLSTSLLKLGLEETILQTIYPFFEKVGILWQTGVIFPAQEHFVSNLIRQKLNVAIDGIVGNENPASKSFLIFLPEGELHEIGILFFHFLAKKYGHKVIYLGQSVPFEDLESVQRLQSCDYLLTSFSSSLHGIEINSYIQKLAETFREKQILYSSFEYENINKQFPKNVHRVINPEHFIQILKSFK